LDWATTDVADTIEWLEQQCFRLRRSDGGPGESFGNVYLEYERGGVVFAIARDRSQWIPTVSLPGVPGQHGLQVLLTAMTGTPADAGPPRDLRTPLSEQLPEGVEWRAQVPLILDWLAEADQSPVVLEAAAAWRDAMKRYWKQVEAQGEHDRRT